MLEQEIKRYAILIAAERFHSFSPTLIKLAASDQDIIDEATVKLEAFHKGTKVPVQDSIGNLRAKDGMLQKVATWIGKDRYPEISNKAADELAKTKEITSEAHRMLLIQDLSNRLFEMYGGYRPMNSCEEGAVEILEKVPQEIIPNIEEWLDDKPLSDIKVHGISMNDIFEWNKGKNLSFFDVLCYFIDWKRTEYQDKNMWMMYFFVG